MKIVLTGGIAAGKTLVGDYLASKGFGVVDADRVARELARDDGVRSRIAAAFGERFLTEDGFDRRALRAAVFGNAERVAALNAIMHPAIYRELQRRLDAAGGDTVVAVPLWFDTPYRLRGVDEVWTVTAPEALRIKRLTARDTISEETARAMLDAQVSDGTRFAGSDRIIVNDGTPEELYVRVDAALRGD